MIEQPAALRRCASCERWTGSRSPGEQRTSVLIDAEGSTGLCNGGPWDGSERRARSACGKWQIWQLLDQTPDS